MNSEVMKTCADMIITAAIQDKAKRENRSIDSVRSELICSDAFEALYDFDTGLWQEGPDYFLSYYGGIERCKEKALMCKKTLQKFSK